MATERDKDVISYTAFTGLRDDVSPERFGPTDLQVATNVNLDSTGRISRRAGRAELSATATHSLFADRELGFCVQGTTLYQINPNYSLTSRRTGLTAGARVSYARVNDRVYAANGAEALVVEHGQARTWGLPVPPYPTITAAAGGQLPAGAYQLTATYLRDDGQESGARIAARIEVGQNEAITLVFAPVIEANVVAHNIYLSPANGDVMYLALTVPVADASAVYAGDTSEFSYPLKTQFLSAPPAGHLVAYFRGRMLVAVDDVIYPSEPFAYELFDLRRYIPTDGRVTLLAAMEDKVDGGSGLFIGTDKSCGVLVGAESSEFRYVPKVNYGAVPGAVATVDGTLFADGASGARQIPVWQTTEGLCAGLPGLEVRNLTRSKYTVLAGGQGAAMFLPDVNRFVAVSNF